jgi:preprotein translocase subunit SecD
MNRGWYWRLGTVLFVIVAAFVVLWPSIPKLSTPWVRAHIPFRLNEGLDIRGGARLSYDVQIGQAIADRRARSMEDFRGQLASDFGIHHGEGRLTPDEITRLAERVTVVAGSTNREFVARFRNAADVARVNDRMISNRGLRRLGSSGNSITLGLDPREVTALEDSAVQQAIQTITNRIDELAVKETSITARGETIVVEVPGQDQAYFQQIRDIIRRTARLEFKILDDESPALAAIIAGQAIPGAPPAAEGAPAPTPHPLPAGITQETELAPVGPGRNAQSTYLRSTGPNARQQLQDYLESIRPLIPEGRQILVGKSDRSEGAASTGETWRTYTVFSVAQVDGSMIDDARVSVDPQENRPFVSLTFNRRGGEVFARVTEENVKKRFAIVLDDRVNSAPQIQQRIGGGSARITLGGDSDYRIVLREANELVVVLRAGALPAPLSEGKQDYVGPTLGSDTIRHARNAMMVGISLVLLFMAVYYGYAGWIANGAVLVNLALQLATMVLFGATITLPGLAGLALTVGMSVDNNVLINERIREELRDGKSLRAAVDAGYNHAFSAIFDGHVTTLISGVVLLQYGTGPVKGFAVTLLIGVIANLFTGVFATRVVFDWLVRGLKVKTLLGAK